MKKRWRVNRTNIEFLEHLSKKASISLTLAQILINRGLKDLDSIKDFLYPSLDNLHNPFLLPDMGKAVDRIKTAMSKREIVLVCGDYDVDGITSTALLVSALRSAGLETFYYIPNRIIQGYGFSPEGIKKARSIGAGLIITVDCGISAVDEVASARSSGLDVIITDHHEPPQRLPDALAVINPRRIDSEYPFKGLAGVGVAYKLAQALLQDTGYKMQDTVTGEFLALAALGTIADSVPLTGENRILVTYGIKALNNNPSRPWMPYLKDSAGIINRDIRSGLLAYTIIPRINAAGRIGDANEVVELFLTQDASEAKRISDFLEEQNRKRQKIEEGVFRSALAQIDASDPGHAIVLYSTEWHQGVIGIVASRLVEMFYRPAILFSVKDSIAKGSGRSIPPFNIHKGISECSDLLLSYGGHSQAAGIKLHIGKMPDFTEKINIIVESALRDKDVIPSIEIEAGMELSDINFNLIKELSRLEPFGMANQEPVFGAKSIEILNPKVVGTSHLKMRVKQRSVAMDAIGFNMGGLLSELSNPGAKVDVAFVPGINDWNGNSSLQLNLKAVRPGSKN
ncbi:MAG: single-stranded-DNA-specific exonuclease RecJ [Nitrospirae bacterium]|nr:single-stranded-DNA-specific exonuclease RecJ [Nitrospirota bacterium]